MSKTVTVTVACKHCGSTVMLKKSNVTDTTSEIGGIVTEACRKCGQTSIYNYRMREGQFTELD